MKRKKTMKYGMMLATGIMLTLFAFLAISGPAAADDALKAISNNGVNASINMQSEWDGGYCANVILENTSTAAVTNWSLVIDINQSTLSQLWSANYTQSGSQVTVTPSGWNANIAPGNSVSFGFCGSGSGRPELASMTVTGGGGGDTDDTYTLTISVNGNGSTDPAPGTYTFDAGESVTVIATPLNDAMFSGWSGAATGNANPVTIIMNGDKTLTAIFSGSGTCPHGLVNAEEVVIIGDSYLVIPGTQISTVRDLAREAGAIGPNDNYVNVAVPGSPIQTIMEQYNSREAGPVKIKVLIMDGGGIDTWNAGGTQASIDYAVSMFKQHLEKVASDGTVEHIIYQLYPEIPPEANIPGLRPGIRAACAESTVPCHFLDLQPLFEGHPEYIGSDGIHPSEIGGVVMGNAIWKIMQDNCIAQ